MKQCDRYIIQGKCLITLSISILILATGLTIAPAFAKENLNFNYEYINIKDMATATVSKKEDPNIIFKNLFASVEETKELKETSLPLLNNTVPTLPEPKQIWYLPTEVGRITQYPHYSHVALDITSYRGSAEHIFPVANGVISSIYTDSAGAKIVTIYHNINGQDYTSQYVHLSSYAPDLYVGKNVTVNDSIGLMGTTGRSTGVHLHITVADCHLFDQNDPYCKDLNSFFNYAKRRFNEGHLGLGSMINVPWSWNSR